MGFSPTFLSVSPLSIVATWFHLWNLTSTNLCWFSLFLVTITPNHILCYLSFYFHHPASLSFLTEFDRIETLLSLINTSIMIHFLTYRLELQGSILRIRGWSSLVGLLTIKENKKMCDWRARFLAPFKGHRVSHWSIRNSDASGSIFFIDEEKFLPGPMGVLSRVYN